MTVSKAIAQAWANPEFKKKLVNDPHAALAEHGVQVPEGMSIKVVENTDDTVHLVLPSAPESSGEMASEELENLAAAGGLGTPVNTVSPPYC